MNFSQIFAVFSPNSTRAPQYFQKIRPFLQLFSLQHAAVFREIELDDLPYFSARAKIFRELNYHSKTLKQVERSTKSREDILLIACGGDGVSQVTFDAAWHFQTSRNSGNFLDSSEKAGQINFREDNPELIFATVPLGNGNDLARALNGHTKNPEKILTYEIRDFHPILLEFLHDNSDKNPRADNSRKSNSSTTLEITHPNSRENITDIALASYVSFGATTLLVDLLNDKSSRRRRAKLKHFSPLFSLPFSQLNQLSRQISELKNLNFSRENFNSPETSADAQDFNSPKHKDLARLSCPSDFSHENKINQNRPARNVSDEENLEQAARPNFRELSVNSFGFFNLSAAKNLLKVSRQLKFSTDKFYFHFATIHAKNLFEDCLLGGRWLAKFPGEISTSENLVFASPQNLIANVAGDNLTFENIRAIRAQKTKIPLKIFAK